MAVSVRRPTIPVVGFLSSGARGALHQALAAFTDGLKQSGHVEGQCRVSVRATMGGECAVGGRLTETIRHPFLPVETHVQPKLTAVLSTNFSGLLD